MNKGTGGVRDSGGLQGLQRGLGSGSTGEHHGPGGEQGDAQGDALGAGAMPGGDTRCLMPRAMSNARCPGAMPDV